MPKTITPEELKRQRRRYGLTQREFADFMGTTANTLARWERGERPLNQGWVRLALELLRSRAGRRLGA